MSVVILLVHFSCLYIEYAYELTIMSLELNNSIESKYHTHVPDSKELKCMELNKHLHVIFKIKDFTWTFVS